MTRKNAQGNNTEIAPPRGLQFKITDTKLYVPAATLSKENYIKLLEQLKTGFKKSIKCNKCRSQMTIQPQNNNLNYLIDPTFTNANRLFVLPFTRDNASDNGDSSSHYYVPNNKLFCSYLVQELAYTLFSNQNINFKKYQY